MSRCPKTSFCILVFCMMHFFTMGQGSDSSNAYQDLTHDSKVFGHKKFYRLYLPKGYDSSSKRYPVVYFFHGWGGRHFKDDNAKLEYVKIKQLVDKYQLILVMWDGNIEEWEPRPYNVGNHEDVKFQVQMKDYFPELIDYIDHHYRTLTDRNHRGIIGFSMGGFMSFFLAGKYPDKVCAAVSLAGSPEFFVGKPGSHTLYPVRYTFKNLRDVDIRLHNGNSDILYYLNEEVHAGALWDGKARLKYWTFNGGHMVDDPGETRVFETALKFVKDAFKKNKPAPHTWSHYDLYPSFSVWGYQLESDKQSPGFIYLRQVNKTGFGLYTQKWLPRGPALPDVHINISTPPVYTPGKTYNLVQAIPHTDSVKLSEAESDTEGRIAIESDGKGREIGIFKKTDAPEFVFLDYKANEESAFLKIGRHNKLAVRLFNRRGENGLPAGVRVKLSVSDTTLELTNATVSAKAVAGQRILDLPAFDIACFKKAPPHAEPAEVKFTLTIYAGKKQFNDEFIVPVLFSAPNFDSLKIDDGLRVMDAAWGTGNANGIAEAGERIMLYQGNHRLRLYTDDPWVQKEKEQLTDEIIPARWPDGFTLSSVIQLSPDCPDGHIIRCLASYETKAFNPIERKVTWGYVNLAVSRK